mmetsp:Transcript_117561/g.279130  ORF Transcript_117561/g.279130 Transcript_117561/m.279130 type:complete len:170 (-) Transcript_117561:276-785(-)
MTDSCEGRCVKAGEIGMAESREETERDEASVKEEGGCDCCTWTRTCCCRVGRCAAKEVGDTQVKLFDGIENPSGCRNFSYLFSPAASAARASWDAVSTFCRFRSRVCKGGVRALVTAFGRRGAELGRPAGAGGPRCRIATLPVLGLKAGLRHSNAGWVPMGSTARDLQE